MGPLKQLLKKAPLRSRKVSFLSLPPVPEVSRCRDLINQAFPGACSWPWEFTSLVVFSKLQKRDGYNYLFQQRQRVAPGLADVLAMSNTLNVPS